MAREVVKRAVVVYNVILERMAGGICGVCMRSNERGKEKSARMNSRRHSYKG